MTEHYTQGAAGKVKRSPRELATDNPQSFKFAIAAHCYHDCQGQEETNSHLTKRAVANCTNTSCSLWAHRGWRELVRYQKTGDMAIRGEPLEQSSKSNGPKTPLIDREKRRSVSS